METLFSILPTELRQIILSLCPWNELTNKGNISDLKSVCNDPKFWIALYKRDLSEIRIPYKKNVKNRYLKRMTLLSKMNPNNMLMHGSDYGEEKIVEKALNMGANIHAYNDAALVYTSSKGHLDIVKYLVEHGANIHAGDDDALRRTSYNGRLNVVEYLVEHGADIHADNDGALGSASLTGYLDIVKYLVEHGANVHAQNDWALRYANERGHSNIVKYLVEHGADPNVLYPEYRKKYGV